MEKVKPEKLYRGIVVNYELFGNIDFNGEMVPPNPPKTDEDGRKTVADGNEYGLYMTDYLEMAERAYGNPKCGGGKTIGEKRYFNSRNEILNELGRIGVIYEIDTEGLEVRTPWISSGLRGHYNNGFVGDEWIADKIPAENYCVICIVIGKDFLHEEVRIPVKDIESAKTQLDEIIKKREEHFRRFHEVIKQLKPGEINEISNRIGKGALYIDLFGDNELYNIDLQQMQLSTENDKANYLIACFYNTDQENIDYKTLLYIEDVKRKVIQSGRSIEETIADDMQANRKKRDEFIRRKEEQQETYSTDAFDTKYKIMQNILKVLERAKADREKTTQKLGEETRDEQEDTKLKKEVDNEMAKQGEQIKSENEVDARGGQ